MGQAMHKAQHGFDKTHILHILQFVKSNLITMFLLFWLVSSFISKAYGAPTAAGKLELLSVVATSLAGNGVATDVKQELMVYLPPSFQGQPNKRYPVVYWLLDFNQGIYAIKELKAQLDLWFARPENQEFVLVAVTGTNKLGGSFYLNSTLTGAWQDYLLWDLQPQVAQQVRVRSDQFGVAWIGFGMGGLAALNLGLQYPSQASIVAAFSPMVMENRLMKQFLPQIPRPVLHAYAAVVTPTEGEEYGVLPQFDDSEADLEIQQAWFAGMANWEEKMALYFREYPNSRILLGCSSGSAQGFRQGCEALHKAFEVSYLAHNYISYSGASEAIWQAQFKQSALPWLQQNLQF